MEKETFETCLNIAKGCHDYQGGHHQKETNEAFHHGIQTVINSLEALGKRGLKDTQVAVLNSIGKDSN